MPKGTVAKWLNHKGLGFITPAGETEGENDLLVHHTEIKQSGDGFKTLKVGSSVEFTVGTDSKNPEKKVATGVTGVDGADCEPKGKGKQADGADKKGKGKKVDAVPEEKRIDVEDGLAYTWDEISAHYNRKYKKKEIAAYWEDMKPAKRGRKGKKEAEQPATGKKGKKDEKPDKKGKAKQEPKAKEKKPAGNFKVTVCGGSGGIGQPLSLLMATDPNCGELNIFDLNIAMVAPAGVAADLGHLEKKAKVTGYVMEVGKKPIDHLEECLTGCHLVLVPAGVPRKPGQSRDDLFKINADIAKGIVEACAKYCPDAVLGMIVNPVNSVVPAMAELYKKKGLDPMKIVGITTLDCVRANKFVGEMTGKNPAYINVPVIGGHAGTTILPLFSQDKVARPLMQTRSQTLTRGCRTLAPWLWMPRTERAVQRYRWRMPVLVLARRSCKASLVAGLSSAPM